jgi:hypothetical protein
MSASDGEKSFWEEEENMSQVGGRRFFEPPVCTYRMHGRFNDLETSASRRLSELTGGSVPSHVKTQIVGSSSLSWWKKPGMGLFMSLAMGRRDACEARASRLGIGGGNNFQENDDMCNRTRREW